MTVRLAWARVIGRGRQVWAFGPDGMPIDAASAEQALAPGAAVAVGPADAGQAEIDVALAELAQLVTAAGVVAAGAGVDLGGGFRSARLAGAHGDRRDAVLAAIPFLAPDQIGRLGATAGVLVSLFGPLATKPVGAAAAAAIREERWAALRLGSAASDILGPEQVEAVLALTAADELDPFGAGTPSIVAEQLRRIMEPVSQPRRLRLLVDLWGATCAHQITALRRQRLIRSQPRRRRLDDLRRRYEQFDAEGLLELLRDDIDHEPSLLDAARWTPPVHLWFGWLNRAVDDAIAATALLRTAVAISDLGIAAGLEHTRDQLGAAAGLIDEQQAGAAARRVTGQIGIPARPGCYVRDLHRKSGELRNAKDEAYVQHRIAKARDYGVVVLAAITDSLFGIAHDPDYVGAFSSSPVTGRLQGWRAAAGYTVQRPPAAWEQPPLTTHATATERLSLAERLRRSEPGTDAVDVETLGDLLWYAELADAIAQVEGEDAVVCSYGERLPEFEDPPAQEPDPLVPRLDSITHATAGAAQLLSLGGAVPAACRTWAELAGGLMSATEVAEALTGGFDLPKPLRGLDGSLIPGTKVRVEFARSPRQLAKWAHYMGNCISGWYYIQAATEGSRGLAALLAPDGTIVANIELRPAMHAGRNWEIAEFQARFNNEPDAELAQRVRDWVGSIPAAVPQATVVATSRPPRARGRPARNRLMDDVAEPLRQLVEEQLADAATRGAALVLSALTNGPALTNAAPTGEPLAVVTTLRRASVGRLEAVCRQAINAESTLSRPGLRQLWDASGTRPMALALHRLDPALHDRYDQLGRLVADEPTLGSMRRLARLPDIALARSMDIVGLRLRRTIGRLAVGPDPQLSARLPVEARTNLLCTLLLAVNGGAAGDAELQMTQIAPAGVVAVPGFPASKLYDDDGPWQLAWPSAEELGATREVLWDRVMAHGLQVPKAWLGAGNWPKLWSRAARR